MSVDDETMLALVDRISKAPQNIEDAKKIAILEIKLERLCEDIAEDKKAKAEKPVKEEMAKDKKFTRIIQTIGGFCGISGLLISLINLFNNIFKKP